MHQTCWTCGVATSGFTYRCSQCEQLQEVQQLNEHVSQIGGQVHSQLNLLGSEARSANEALGNISDNLGHLQQLEVVGNMLEVAQLNAIRQLSVVLPKAIARVETTVRWAYQQLAWHLEQQTDVIRSIDETLKTPVQTRANEWRAMADTLRERGALNEAVEFYEKSLAESPLDYRTYVGYAEALIQLEQSDKALSILTQSLPHAPRNTSGEISDWRSHSLRTIAHIHHCQGSHERELKILQQAVALSPKYKSVRYEMAVAAAECQQLTMALETLGALVHESDLYFEMARRQAAFRTYREEIKQLLQVACEARINNKVLVPSSEFRQELSAAKEALTKEVAAVAKSTAKELDSEISASFATIADYQDKLRRLDEARKSPDLEAIESQARQLKQQRDAFHAWHSKDIEVLKRKMAVLNSERRNGQIALIITFAFFAVLIVIAIIA